MALEGAAVGKEKQANRPGVVLYVVITQQGLCVYAKHAQENSLPPVAGACSRVQCSV